MQQPPSQDTGGASSELRSDAQQLGSKAANRLHSELDARKDTAVSQAQSVSSAIRQTADGLDESAPAWLRSAFQQGAQQIQRFADSIENKDSRQLMREAQDFARNNPGTFLAACAAAGFAAARIFKAGGEQQQRGQQFSTPGKWDQSSDAGWQQPWSAGDDFGQDELMDDTFGQGQSGEPFVARPDTAPAQPLNSSDTYDDPLVLGTGGEAGRRVPNTGDTL